MQIDISRDTFDPTKHFTRLLMLQGRVQLDADWNEQGASLWHYLRTLVVDLVGPGWGPGDSFRVRHLGHDTGSPLSYQFEAEKGSYYVHGLPVCIEGKEHITVEPKPNDNTRIVWLRAAEQLVTAVEDESIREVALGGADTAARTKIVHDLCAESPPPKVTPDTAIYYRLDPDTAWRLFHPEKEPEGRLSARVHSSADTSGDACILAADSAYRGLENQLYRVQIYQGGKPAASEGATFLWSRDYGSVLAQWRKTNGWTNEVEGVGRDGLSGFAPGQWVQLLDGLQDKMPPAL